MIASKKQRSQAAAGHRAYCRFLVGGDMAKEYAKSFYKSKAWQRCRDEYAKSVNWLCEDCLEQGIYKPGEIVHHMIEITPENINDPMVTLNWDNLRLVCRECHAENMARK